MQKSSQNFKGISEICAKITRLSKQLHTKFVKTTDVLHLNKYYI